MTTEQIEKWREALEELGPEVVRVRLFQTGERSVLSGFGDLKRGYAERWLFAKDQAEAKSRKRWNWAIFLPALVAAIAAVVAAWPVARAWLQR